MLAVRPVFLLFEGDGPCDGSACSPAASPLPLVCICFCCTVRQACCSPRLQRSVRCCFCSGVRFCAGLRSACWAFWPDLPGAVGTRRFFCARFLLFPAKQPRFPRRRWPRRRKAATGSPSSARLTLDGKNCTAVIYFDEADGEIRPGSLLSGTAKFTTAQEKHLHGKDYDLSRGVFLTASCRETLHAEPGRASVWLAPALFAERLRAAIQSAFPSDTAGFVQALLLGDKTGLRYEDQNDLAIAGIYHAVAVSGMHVSILLGMILLLCGGNHRLAAALGLPAAVFFIVMTGAPASAVRAGVMQALVLCAPLVRRENGPADDYLVQPFLCC